MGSRLLQFPDVSQAYPAVRPAGARARDFGEIYGDFDPVAAETQAARCSQCGIPFCQIHCPLQNNIPDWLKLTAEGRLEEAYAVSSATNTFPEICGRICPQDRLCEGSCVIEHGFGSVTIGSVEKYITETAFDEGWVKPFSPAFELGQSVGIIGAGPAGLAAGEQLRRRGYEVHIYDRYDRVGGLMIYGIPNFKLEKSVVERRRRWFEDSGVRFHLRCEVGTTVSFAELRAEHDAVLIATGVYKSRGIEAPGLELDGLHEALPYLVASNLKGLGDDVPEFDSGMLNAAGKRVVVIGGGDTAMDCVRTAVRQGAASVKCLYRRDRDNMPGSAREVKNAEEEGVEFVWLSTPRAFKGRSGKLDTVVVQRMRLGEADASGRKSIRPVEGDTYAMDADMAILALGFTPEDIPQRFETPDLAVHDRYGTVLTGTRAFRFSLEGGILAATSLEGVFAAGDIVRGASLVVWAIRDGREAAQGIDAYLRALRGARQVAYG